MMLEGLGTDAFSLTNFCVGVYSTRRSRKALLLLLPESRKFVVLVTKLSRKKVGRRIERAIAERVQQVLECKGPFVEHCRPGGEPAVLAFDVDWESIRGVDYKFPLIEDGRIVFETAQLTKRVFKSVKDALDYYKWEPRTGAGKETPGILPKGPSCLFLDPFSSPEHDHGQEGYGVQPHINCPLRSTASSSVDSPTSNTCRSSLQQVPECDFSFPRMSTSTVSDFHTSVPNPLQAQDCSGMSLTIASPRQLRRRSDAEVIYQSQVGVNNAAEGPSAARVLRMKRTSSSLPGTERDIHFTPVDKALDDHESMGRTTVLPFGLCSEKTTSWETMASSWTQPGSPAQSSSCGESPAFSLRTASATNQGSLLNTTSDSQTVEEPESSLAVWHQNDAEEVQSDLVKSTSPPSAGKTQNPSIWPLHKGLSGTCSDMGRSTGLGDDSRSCSGERLCADVTKSVTDSFASKRGAIQDLFDGTCQDSCGMGPSPSGLVRSCSEVPRGKELWRSLYAWVRPMGGVQEGVKQVASYPSLPPLSRHAWCGVEGLQPEALGWLRKKVRWAETGDASAIQGFLSEPPSPMSKRDTHQWRSATALRPRALPRTPSIPPTSRFTSPTETYHGRTLVLNFRDGNLPASLADCVKRDVRLLKLCESGLPGWAVFLPSYGLYYRPWMRKATWILYYLVSIISMVLGFYDLYKNIPYFKRLLSSATALWLPASALFEWLEHHTQLRLSILFTYLFGKSPLFVTFLQLLSAILQPLLALLTPALQLLAKLKPVVSFTQRVIQSTSLMLKMLYNGGCLVVGSVLGPPACALWTCLTSMWVLVQCLVMTLWWLTTGLLWGVGSLCSMVSLVVDGPWQVLVLVKEEVIEAVCVLKAWLGVIKAGFLSVVSLGGWLRNVRAPAGSIVSGSVSAAMSVGSSGGEWWSGPWEAVMLMRIIVMQSLKGLKAVISPCAQLCLRLYQHRFSTRMQLQQGWARTVALVRDRGWGACLVAFLPGGNLEKEREQMLDTPGSKSLLLAPGGDEDESDVLVSDWKTHANKRTRRRVGFCPRRGHSLDLGILDLGSPSSTEGDELHHSADSAPEFESVTGPGGGLGGNPDPNDGQVQGKTVRTAQVTCKSPEAKQGASAEIPSKGRMKNRAAKGGGQPPERSEQLVKLRMRAECPAVRQEDLLRPGSSDDGRGSASSDQSDILVKAVVVCSSEVFSSPLDCDDHTCSDPEGPCVPGMDMSL